MDLALYDPSFGYYATAARRSGAAGDFVTSVDVGPLFGELLEIQIAEMAALIAAGSDARSAGAAGLPFDLVEAGAGNGTLSADILRAARRRHPDLLARTRLHLVEASPAARADQRRTLGDAADRLSSTGQEVAPFDGVLVANELLDAMPVHQVVMREDGLREIFVTEREGRLATIEGPPSSSALAEYFDRLGVRLEPGWRAEVNLRAVDWVRTAARRLGRGFLILIDYGHDARELYSVTHAQGTLTTFDRHVVSDADRAAAPAWLERPGRRDITSHVDFTSVERVANEEGLVTIGFLDQTYFLLGILGQKGSEDLETWEGPEGLKEDLAGSLQTRLALKTLLMPGGLGSTLKVMIFGKNVGQPALAGCSYRMRVT